MTPLTKRRSLAKPEADPKALTAKPRNPAMPEADWKTPLTKRRSGGLS